MQSLFGKLRETISFFHMFDVVSNVLCVRVCDGVWACVSVFLCGGVPPTAMTTQKQHQPGPKMGTTEKAPTGANKRPTDGPTDMFETVPVRTVPGSRPIAPGRSGIRGFLCFMSSYCKAPTRGVYEQRHIHI
jgi:hypothetical protein